MRSPLRLVPVALVAVLASCSFELDYDKYAIVYGVSLYDLSKPEGTSPNLSYADDDALAVSDLLEQQGYSAAPYTRVDAAATKAALEADIAAVRSAIEAKPDRDALLLLYFSGHGGQGPADPGVGTETAAGADDFEEWIFLHGSIDPGGNPVFSATVNDDALAALLNTVPGRKKIVIIDACFSGGFIGNQLEYDAVPPDYGGSVEGFLSGLVEAVSLYGSFDGYTSDIAPVNAMVLAAAGEREASYEGSYGHGVFTYFLLQAAGRADANTDGYVTVREAYDFTRRQIDIHWNASFPQAYRFAPRVSGGPVDYVLFATGR